jgi:hypothetical protein
LAGSQSSAGAVAVTVAVTVAVAGAVTVAVAVAVAGTRFKTRQRQYINLPWMHGLQMQTVQWEPCVEHAVFCEARVHMANAHDA